MGTAHVYRAQLQVHHNTHLNPADTNHHTPSRECDLPFSVVIHVGLEHFACLLGPKPLCRLYTLLFVERYYNNKVAAQTDVHSYRFE